MSSKEYWDSVAASKTFTHGLALDVMRPFLPVSAKILDYGCGYGRTLSELHKEGYTNAIGIDFSPLMIQKGIFLHPHLSLEVCDGNEIPFDSSAFDLVILFAVLTCIPGNTDQNTLIDEINRVLRPGGIIYVSDYLLGDDPRNVRRYEHYTDRYENYGVFEVEGTTLRHHSLDRIKALTKMFSEVSFAQFTAKTMNGDTAKGFQYVGRKFT